MRSFFGKLIKGWVVFVNITKESSEIKKYIMLTNLMYLFDYIDYVSSAKLATVALMTRM